MPTWTAGRRPPPAPFRSPARPAHRPTQILSHPRLHRDWRAGASARLASLAPAEPLPAPATMRSTFPALRALDLSRARPVGAEDVEALLTALPGLEAVVLALPTGASAWEARAPASARAPPRRPVAPAEEEPAPVAAADAAGAVLPPPRTLARIATRPREPTSPPPPPADDVAAAVGRGAPAARRLDFSRSPGLTDAGLARLASLPLPRLTALALDGCTSLTDAGLAAAAAGLGARLTELRLASSAAPSTSGGAVAGAAPAPAHPPPARLAWPATKISDAGCLALAANAPRLAVLDLRGHSGVTPAGVAAVAAACPLASLSLAGGPAATDAGVAAAALAGGTLRHLRVEAAGRAWRNGAAAVGPMDAADLLAAAFAALPPTPATAAGGGSPLARAAALAAAAVAAHSPHSPWHQRGGGEGGWAAASIPEADRGLSAIALTGSALVAVAARLPCLTSLALVGVEWAAGERLAVADSHSYHLSHLTALDLSGPPRSALAARPADEEEAGGGRAGVVAATTPRTSPPLDALDLRALASLDVSGSGLAGGAAAALGARAGRLACLRAARCHGLKPPHLAALLARAAPRLASLDVRGCEGLARAGAAHWAPLSACAWLTSLALGPASVPAGPAWFAGGGDPWAERGAGLSSDSDDGSTPSRFTPDGGDAGSEAALASASALPRLASLTLAGVPLTPAAGAAIGAMPALARLAAAGCPAAAGPSCPPGPAGALAPGFEARAAGGLGGPLPPPALASLDLSHTDAGGREVGALLAALGPALTALDLTGCPWGGGAGDVAALSAAPRLAALALGGPVPPGAGDGLADAGLAALAAAAPALASLTISSPGAGLTPRGLRQGLAGLASLSHLSLPGGEGLADPAAVLACLTAAGVSPRLASLGLADPGGAAARAVGPATGRAPRLAEGELSAFLAASPRLARLDLRGVSLVPGPGRPPAARAAAAAASAAGGALLAAALDAAGLAALAVDTVAGAAAAGVGRLVAGVRRGGGGL